jgi:thiamine pyrophosphokinase
MSIDSATVAIVANGDIFNYSLIYSLLKKYSSIIAVDGGLVHLDKMNILPNLIIGDFDSAPEHLLKKYSTIPRKQYPRDKNETDLELSLKEIDPLKTNKITLFGALGKRGDHSLYNLSIVLNSEKNVFMETETEIIFAIRGTNNRIDCFPGQTISFLSIGNSATGINSRGLKWELSSSNQPNKELMSLSNISLGLIVNVSIQKGTLLCFLQKQP